MSRTTSSLLAAFQVIINGRVWTPPLLQASCSIACRYDCLRVSGLFADAVLWASDPDGLFAHRLPIAYTSSRALRPYRVLPTSVQPIRHQTICLAIVVDASFLDSGRSLGITQLATERRVSLPSTLGRNPCRRSRSPRQLAPSCWPTRQRQRWHACAPSAY